MANEDNLAPEPVAPRKIITKISSIKSVKSSVLKPLFDPTADNALVLYDAQGTHDSK
jgi:hypothetical protein